MIGWIEDELAIVAVEQGVFTGAKLPADVMQADHGGETQRAGHDGCVGRFTANVGGEAEHHFFVHRRGARGRQVVADEDARLGELAEVQPVLPAHEIVQDARGDIPHVGGAFSQIFVLQSAERGGVFFCDLLEGVFGGNLLVQDPSRDFLDERGVFEHEQVRVEDAGFSGAESLVDLALDFEDLLARLGQGLFEAADLLRHFLLRNIAPQHRIVLSVAQDENFPTANPG